MKKVRITNLKTKLVSPEKIAKALGAEIITKLTARQKYLLSLLKK
jgi:hypothetical protein